MSWLKFTCVDAWDFKQILDVIRPNLPAISVLINNFRAELSERKPATHADHDRIIARLKKFCNIMRSLTWVRAIRSYVDELLSDRPYHRMWKRHKHTLVLYARPIERIEDVIKVLDAFKESVKRTRLYVLKFVWPWLSEAFHMMSNVKVELRRGELGLRFGYVIWSFGYSIHYERVIYCHAYTDSWKSLRTIKPEEFDEILGKILERDARVKQSQEPILWPTKYIFEVRT